MLPLSFILMVTVFTACTSFSGNYADANKAEIVNDKWNETDARVVSKKMLDSALSRPWLVQWNREHQGKPPALIVDDFENRTSEHIDTKAIFEAVSTELINGGRVRFLDGERRKKLLEEYRYQNSGVVGAQGRKQAGKQIAADFFLSGGISSIVAEQNGYKTVTYQVQMKLTNIETSEIVWTEVYKLKKQFQRSSFGG